MTNKDRNTPLELVASLIPSPIGITLLHGSCKVSIAEMDSPLPQPLLDQPKDEIVP